MEILVTGAAGFIGSCMTSHLVSAGYNVIAVDDFLIEGKKENFKKWDTNLVTLVQRDNLVEFLQNRNNEQLICVVHLGARTDTTEFNEHILDTLNMAFTKDMRKLCTELNIPFIYASSAATYGDEEHGFNDNHTTMSSLKPLNPYGWSKHLFDIWALGQTKEPSFWIGLKFFNVYGPNEYHKGRMASVIFHAYNKIQEHGKMSLFRSHREGIENGEQKRDFIYVKDVISVMDFFLINRSNSSLNGIYNLGTGIARSFNDLVKATFTALEKEKNIEYIDMPLDIRENYQYFTEANMGKLKSVGYDSSFMSLEEGVLDYVQGYLLGSKYL